MSTDPIDRPEDAGEGEGADGQATAGPFDATPRDLPPTDRGCSRMALAGCALITLVVGLAVLTMILKATDLVGWSLSRIRTEVERTLPSDLPPADRQRFDAAFDAALAGIERGELDPVAFQALQTELLQFARRTTPPTTEDVRGLIRALEAFAGIDAGEPESPEESEPRQVARAVG